ncbi:uncharacterized protein LOC124719620 isoform X4 [Schistocerca piceifrons]|uniref:uncharacterized protein LOC124719620 isoform X4 n=1 Tax=Schistocerca piceifrons TaxID=274613 RepID=UPI001F5E9B58|nr:uncharacterized protein LOC124719620 isoform X4 [Schistocerca piceifrons]
MYAGPYRLVKCPGLHTAAMDYRNIIWIKTEPTDEISTVPDSTVRVCPSTVNVKEELQECVNQEFPEHPLVTLESTNCSKEETQKKLGPEETENILCIPEFEPQAMKEEGLEFDDCLHECDPLDIRDEEGIASERLAPHSPSNQVVPQSSCIKHLLQELLDDAQQYFNTGLYAEECRDESRSLFVSVGCYIQHSS